MPMRRHSLSSPALARAVAHCRWWPGMPSWYTVVVSSHVLCWETPSGTDHHMRPGREKSALGGV